MLGVMGTLAYLLTPRAITSIPRFGASPSRLLQSHRSILFSSGERMPALVLVNTGMPVFAACVRTYNMNEFRVETTMAAIAGLMHKDRDSCVPCPSRPHERRYLNLVQEGVVLEASVQRHQHMKKSITERVRAADQSA